MWWKVLSIMLKYEQLSKKEIRYGAPLQAEREKNDGQNRMYCGYDTFFSMVYILMVNANMFADPFGDGSNPLGVTYGAIYIATAVSAVLGTTLVGVLSNLPLAQASGMGLNAFFFVAMFLSPIAQLIPSCATAAALIYVGLLMMASIRNIDWDDFRICVPAFLTLSIMPFTYNISYGIAFGLISYIVISVFCGETKKIKASSWSIAILFVAMLLLTH